MATQVSLNSGAVASAGALALQTNGTTEAVSISTGQVATLAQNPVLTSGTANGVAYLNGSKVLTTGSALTFDGTNLKLGTVAPSAYSGYTVAAIGGTNGGVLQLANTAGTNTFEMATASGATYIKTVGASDMWFGINNTEAMRISSATGGVGAVGIGYSTLTSVGNNGLAVLGNVGIGTSSPGQPLHVSKNQNASTWAYVSNTTAGTGSAAGFLFASDVVTGAIQAVSSLNTGLGNNNSLWIRTTGAYPITLGTNSTVQMTLESSGNLLVGTTNVEGRLTVKSAGSTSASYHTVFRNSAGTGIFILRDDGRPELPWSYTNTTGSAANVFIDASGILFRSTSSLKYKTNVQNATHGLADLLQLRPVTYEGKAETDVGKTFGGLIAEEVHEAGLTEFVQYAEDGSPDALAYGNMVSLCIKAIQEQQALITQLTARITALEGA